MASWQARCVSLGIKVRMRRHDWGDERMLTRRSRTVFGAPRPMQWLRTRGGRIDRIDDGAMHGEWVTPRDAGAGVILYFHGGGYVGGSAARNRPITAALARLSRRCLLSVDYRLAPEHRFPAALDDAVAAYRWLLDRSVSPGDVALSGDSAGGGLALATMLRLRDDGLPLPACAVLFCPWTDLTGSGESLHGNDGRCATFRPANIPDFARVYLGAASASNPYASSVFAELGGLPPVLSQVGSNELLLDDARRVHDKILAAGGVSKLEVFDDVCHVWHMLDGFVPEARTALAQAVAFIADHARAVTPAGMR